MQRPCSLRRVCDNLRNPADAAPFSRFLARNFRAGFFAKCREESVRRSPINSPGICVYKRATLESGLTLEDPRLGAIDRRLGVYACACVCMGVCMSYVGALATGDDEYSYMRRKRRKRGLMVPLVHISRKAAGIRIPDWRCVIISSASVPPNENSNFLGRLLAARQNDGPGTRAITPRHCEIARVSQYIFSSPFRSFAARFLVPPPQNLCAHPPFDTVFPTSTGCFRSWRCSLKLTYRPVIELLWLFLARRVRKNARCFLSHVN